MIDDLILQRLIDGELEDDQIRQLLRQADEASPDASDWKQLAVAFAENQMFRRGFHGFHDAMVQTGIENGIHDHSAFGDKALFNTTHQATDAELNNPSFWWTLAIAACVMITTAIGYQQRHAIYRTFGIQVAERQVVEHQTTAPAAQALQDFSRTSLLTIKPDGHLEVDRLPRGLKQISGQPIPLYNARRFPPQKLAGLRSNDAATRQAFIDQIMPTESINDQTKSDYQNAGVMVDQDIEFLSGQLDDGRVYVIPYRSVKFTAGL
jgi:hypothetical protein